MNCLRNRKSGKDSSLNHVVDTSEFLSIKFLIKASKPKDDKSKNNLNLSEDILEEISEQSTYSILDLMKYKHVEDYVYSIKGMQQKYVQIKATNFILNKKQKVLLQIIDVSHSIMYDQQKAENSFLALINACVSHELRNPLNSIIA